MSDRFFALFLFSLGLLYGITALQITVPIAYDPLGPKPLPLILAILHTGLALLVILRPEKKLLQHQSLPRKVFFLLAIMLFYQATWMALGFLLSTTISLYLLSQLFNCSWMQGLMTSLVTAVIGYALFNFILQIPLPLGTLFSYGSS
ncbi:putative tricarboxylic transport membrane protein [Desulfuromusa kysingii]|uniref:Putative tricarboxylic transport membrane protein n=1 Tax=Desulfuromusa kysingii TaxID=37625 RepID=A0A1H4DXE9_9BACT|nr:tripartite tricarboxylate transporter TctB family protein [Desulfuromusa kysingii]SEA77266.1 putative tricarboxylic transport membrane protein [Desulfuromusa kysingii]